MEALGTSKSEHGLAAVGLLASAMSVRGGGRGGRLGFEAWSRQMAQAQFGSVEKSHGLGSLREGCRDEETLQLLLDNLASAQHKRR